MWPTYWLTDWQIDGLTDWLIDWLIDWQVDCLTDWSIRFHFFRDVSAQGSVQQVTVFARRALPLVQTNVDVKQWNVLIVNWYLYFMFIIHYV